MQNPKKHFDIQASATEVTENPDLTYGSNVGNVCPQCKQGVMVKLGGCTECSKQCGFKGSCDMK